MQFNKYSGERGSSLGETIWVEFHLSLLKLNLLFRDKVFKLELELYKISRNLLQYTRRNNSVEAYNEDISGFGLKSEQLWSRKEYSLSNKNSYIASFERVAVLWKKVQKLLTFCFPNISKLGETEEWRVLWRRPQVPSLISLHHFCVPRGRKSIENTNSNISSQHLYLFCLSQ